MYSALQDLNNQSQSQKAEYRKNKARGIGEQWQRKGFFAAFTSLLSSFVVDLVVVVVVVVFDSGGGVGGEFALCFEFACTPLSECLEEETKC